MPSTTSGTTVRHADGTTITVTGPCQWANSSRGGGLINGTGTPEPAVLLLARAEGCGAGWVPADLDGILDGFSAGLDVVLD